MKPVDPSVLAAEVTPDTDNAIHEIAERAHVAGLEWNRQPIASRRQKLARFGALLEAATPDLVASMIAHIGKPRSAAEEEVQRAAGHIESALSLNNEQSVGDNGRVIFEPHGAVALITPWNNPVAIAVGKIAAALMLGNSVVWKPAYQADSLSHKLLALLRASGLDGDIVQIVNGGAAQVRTLVANPHIAAVSLTGPEEAGRSIGAICQTRGKPLQAELGGNNALLVISDADIAALAPVWARMAFGFAGQRCTAVRRFVVESAALGTFERHMTAAIDGLVLDSPESPRCDVGPLISARHRQKVDLAVRAARERGARVITGGDANPFAGNGHYYPPTLLADLEQDDAMVQDELFGPVAILQQVDDFEQGLALVNGVRQGLLGGIATGSENARREFLRRCEAGILTDGNGLVIHPAAPFGGRKASQIGPPEHGNWDREFFSRVKVSYQSSMP
jgi:aldehyde dehydrogenase (NAD+)